ncbi:MAG: hypothetical protein AB1767_06360 [Bacillota bacterium]
MAQLRYPRSIIALLLIFVLILVTGCAEPVAHEDVDRPDDHAPDGTGSPDLAVGELAYLSEGDLWLLSGEDRNRLTDSGDVCFFQWSPDGSKLAYIRAAESWPETGSIWLMDADGSAVLLVEETVPLLDYLAGSAGLWLPNSNELAYAQREPDRLRIVNALTGDRRDLDLNGELVRAPRWHPDGELTAAVTAEQVYGSTFYHVTILDRTGTFRRMLTENNAACWWRGGENLVLAGYGIWEISGFYYFTELAEVDARGERYRVLYDGELWNLYPFMEASPSGDYLAVSAYNALILVQPHEAAALLLEQDVMTTYSEFSYPLLFTWARTGNRIAALVYTETGELSGGRVEGYWDLVLVDAATGDTVVLWERIYSVGETEDAVPMRVFRPITWSPGDESLLLQVDRAGGGYDILLLDLESPETPRLLVENACQPVFRPD